MLESGSKLGPYRILAPLGSGGMGEVYRAHDERLGRDVAVKVLKASRIRDPHRLRRFEREARAAGGLNHPAILDIHDIGTHDGMPYVVTELLEGQTLSRHLEEGQLSARRVLELARQVAAGLVAAHEKGIVHRDLKPDNLFVTRDGRIKLLDFGLAKLIESPEAVTESSGPSGTEETASDGAPPDGGTAPGTLLGTAPYMSPEQAAGRPADQRSDIFSFGTVLYEALSGQRPFRGSTPGEVRASILRDDPEPLSTWGSSIPKGVRRIVARCLEKRPEDRFQSARELLSALEVVDATGSHRVSAPGSSGSGPAGEAALPSGRSPGAVPAPRQALLALALVVVLGVAIVVMSRVGPPEGGGGGPAARTPPSIAVLPIRNLTGDASNDYLATGITEVLATDLSSVPGLLVAPRVAKLDDGPTDQETLFDQLRVGRLIEGSLQRSSDRLRVTVRIIAADDASLPWSRLFDGSVNEVFELQRQMVAALLEELRRTSTLPGEAGSAQPGTRASAEPGAFSAFAEARALLDARDTPGNVDRAIDLLTRAAELDPAFALAFGTRSEAYWVKYRDRDPRWADLAREDALTAIRLDPEMPGVRLALALVYTVTGRYDDAIAELEEVLALQPVSDQAYRQLAQALSMTGRTADARAQLDRAIALRPDLPANYRELGLIEFRAGEYANAAAAFEREVELAPGTPSAHQRLGTAYHAMGDLQNAREHYERTQALAPSASAASNLGTIYYAEGRYEDALASYQESLRLRPGVASSHRNLGDAYARLGRPEEAAEAYLRTIALAEEGLTVNPNDVPLISLIGLCEAKLGRYVEAAQRFDAALEIAPDDGDVLYQKAAALALAGAGRDALATLERALDRGHGAALLPYDEDFSSLRGDPRFDALLAGAGGAGR